MDGAQSVREGREAHRNLIIESWRKGARGYYGVRSASNSRRSTKLRAEGERGADQQVVADRDGEAEEGNTANCVATASRYPTATFVTASTKDISRDCPRNLVIGGAPVEGRPMTLQVRSIRHIRDAPGRAALSRRANSMHSPEANRTCSVRIDGTSVPWSSQQISRFCLRIGLILSIGAG
jgi:hypothetical protein